LFLFFAFTDVPFIYFLQIFFDSEGTAGGIVRAIFIFLGSFGPIVVMVLQMIQSTQKVGNIIKYVFMVIPIYSLNFGIIQIAL